MGRLAPVLGIALVGLAAAAARGDRRMVDPATVRAAIESRWAEAAPEGTTLEVRSTPALVCFGGQPVVEVALPGDLRRPGPHAVPVSCRVEGRVVSRGLAEIVLRVRRPVWRTVRALARGEILGPGDLREESAVFEREPTRLFRYDAGRAWRVRRAVEAGVLLRPADLRAVPDIEAGDEILLVSRSGSAIVSIPGRARFDGDVGDLILVQNPLTGGLVRAVVLDSNTAELATPRGAAHGRSANR